MSLKQNLKTKNIKVNVKDGSDWSHSNGKFANPKLNQPKQNSHFLKIISAKV